MSCFCSKLKHGNFSEILERASCESIESKSAPEVSASELVYLRAQVWIFEKKLEQEKNCLANVTESFKKVANEKFELIQELTKQNRSYLQLCGDIQLERSFSMVKKENNEVLQNEVECLQGEVDKNRVILEKVVTQNVELKETIVEKDETINQIGRMYMKLKALTD